MALPLRLGDETGIADSRDNFERQVKPRELT